MVHFVQKFPHRTCEHDQYLCCGRIFDVRTFYPAACCHYFTLLFFPHLFSYQSFAELPKTFDLHGLKEQGLCSTAQGTNVQPGIEEQERQGTRNMEVQKSLPRRLVFRDADKMGCGFISCTGIFLVVWGNSVYFAVKYNN